MATNASPLSHLALLALLTACGDANLSGAAMPSAGPPAASPTPAGAATAPAGPPTGASPAPGSGAAGSSASEPSSTTPVATTPPTMAAPTTAGSPAAMPAVPVLPPSTTPSETAPQPEGTCTDKLLQPGDSSETLSHATGMRTYLLHVPKQYDNSRPVPLVIDMHGYTSNANQQKSISGWAAKSDAEGFVVAWPQGLNDSWNGGDLCCGRSQSTKVDDQGFILALVDAIKERGCIDAKRVYATGLSNGGAMSHMMGCNAAHVFASVAPASMSNGTTPCKPSRPIPITMFRATGDTLVGYEGGGLLPFKSAEDDFTQWQELNGCSGTVTENGACKTNAQCKDGVQVMFCTVESSSSERLGGHALYANATDQMIPVADIVWDVFKRYSLP